MRKIFSLLVGIGLVLSMATAAYAVEGMEGSEHPQSQQQEPNADIDTSDGNADIPQTILTTWDDLIIAVENAKDGDAIYIGTNIEITKSAELGSKDKHITICLDSSYEDDLSAVFVMSHTYDDTNIESDYDLVFENITFDGGNYRCCPLFSFNRNVKIDNCRFINWNCYYGGGYISFLSNADLETNSCIKNSTFENIKTNIAAVNVFYGAKVQVSNCSFKNISGVKGSVINNMGIAYVGANYYENCVASKVDTIIYNLSSLQLETNMNAYELLYTDIPYGWYIKYMFDEEGMLCEPEKLQPYNADSVSSCGLILLMENPYPQETPTTPLEPPLDGGGSDTPDDTQQPSEPPTNPDSGEDDSRDDTSDDTDNKPTIIYKTVYVPVYIEKEPKPEEDPAPTFICGDAVIDTSRSVKLEGYDDGLLHLEDGLTRAQFATILYRLLDADTIEKYDSSDTVFADVASDAWYCRTVTTIAKAGIVGGTGNGNYSPDAPLTWAHIITVLSRFVEPQECVVQNIQYDGWAADAVETAVALGWITDHEAFNPDANISRGELAYLVNAVLAMYR